MKGVCGMWHGDYSCHLCCNRRSRKMRYFGPYVLFKGLQRPGRPLGVDIGHLSLGLALSETNYAYPLCVLPKHPDLMKSPNLIRQFVFDLRKMAFHITNTIDGLSSSGMLDDLTFTHWDETYTSKLVDKLVEPFSVGEEQRKRISDMLAGTWILRAYLDGMNRYTLLKGREEEEEDRQYIF